VREQETGGRSQGGKTDPTDYQTRKSGELSAESQEPDDDGNLTPET
jgi:hypothetical protein